MPQEQLLYKSQSDSEQSAQEYPPVQELYGGRSVRSVKFKFRQNRYPYCRRELGQKSPVMMFQVCMGGRSWPRRLSVTLPRAHCSRTIRVDQRICVQLGIGSRLGKNH